MTKRSSLILLVVGWMFTGCNEIDKLTQFDIEYNESMTIPSTTIVDLPVEISTPDIQTNSEATFAANDTRTDLIERIILDEMEFMVTSPSNGDLSFLKSVTLYIDAEGLPETEIASRDNIPDDVGSTLMLEPSGIDLKEYILKDKFQLKASTVFDEVVTEDHMINMRSVFFVDAKILGL